MSKEVLAFSRNNEASVSSDRQERLENPRCSLWNRNLACEFVSVTPRSLPSADRWREMLRGVEREAQDGLRILMDIVYIVGQKAE
ncbi:hypothetical protein BHYA_0214g00120 [Botrytis hyacinthi]|uniref:Uncharacterized protein n=1 Tax=Botrytis hyacinthi TaxID=278943 RepID=A0A4Z1GHX2_9HELO|nr:hypothetical protein BHYA_0214g00120 [Botrytis hyacinthi]